MDDVMSCFWMTDVAFLRTYDVMPWICLVSSWLMTSFMMSCLDNDVMPWLWLHCWVMPMVWCHAKDLLCTLMTDDLVLWCHIDIISCVMISGHQLWCQIMWSMMTYLRHIVLERIWNILSQDLSETLFHVSVMVSCAPTSHLNLYLFVFQTTSLVCVPL